MDTNTLLLALVALVIVLVVALIALVGFIQRTARDTQSLVPPDAMAEFARGLIEVVVPVVRAGYTQIPGELDDVGAEALIEYLKRKGYYVEPVDVSKPDQDAAG